MIFENIKLAFSSIRANKMRSFLTMLGMIIGISSVIAIVSMGDTMRGMVASEYEAVGTTLTQVYIMPDDDVYYDTDFFIQEEADRIKDAMGDAISYIGFQSGMRVDISSGRKTEMAYLSGLAKNPEGYKPLNIVYGRMFNDRDIEGKKKVIVINTDTAVSLFGVENAVGKTIKTKINEADEELTVVGVYENEQSALQKLLSGGSMAETYVPESLLVGEEALQWSLIYCLNEGQDAAKMQLRIQSYIARMKGIDINTVHIYSAAEEMSSIDGMLGTLSAVVGAIAAISLVVGGIGIMNIMLVSVTERTREIGIRKALGAKTKDIMIQFLIEAAAISAAGGAIGTLFGISVVGIGGLALGIGVVVKPSVILVAVAFSAVVGLVFGMYPAKKAARKDPVEALRYE